MAQNFNQAPYYDDFDPAKNYHRILFKPGYAIQSRELTQSQTILQNQVSSFADNIFAQNSPVTGGKVTTNLNCYYLKLNPTDISNSPIIASKFLGAIITDAVGDIASNTATVSAKVISTAEATQTDPPTLIISYLSGSQFTDGSIIYGGSQYATTSGTSGGSTCTGQSSTASISKGVFYVVNGYNVSQSTSLQYSIGNFVQVNPQTIILDKYDNIPNVRLGLQITENIVNSTQDSSLLDPALKSSNYKAPGADRYQITLTLTTYPLTLGDDTGFIELARIVNGQIVKQVNGSVYSVIDDYFAKRDYETNGDYIVSDFRLTPVANTANSALYDLNIGKGVAYIRGYRVENQSQITLTSDRARNTASIGTNTVLVDYGNYYVVDTANGVFDVDSVPAVDFHSVGAASVNTANANIYNSTLIGSGFIRGLSYVQSGANTANTAAYIYKAFVHDINTNTLSGTVASATPTTITFTDSANVFSSTANAYYGAILTITGGTDGPPNYASDTRTIVNYNGATRTATVTPAFTVTPDSTSTFSISFKPDYINSIVQRNGFGTNTLTANVNINTLQGKVGGAYYGATVLQNAGQPELVFPVGQAYVASVTGSSYFSTQTFRNQAFNSSTKILTLNIPNSSYISFNGTVGSTYSGDAFKNLFTVVSNQTGQILDFTSTANGSATLISATQLQITLGSGTAYSASIHANVNVIASTFVATADSARKTKTLAGGNYTATANTTVLAYTAISGVSNTTYSSDGTNPTGQVYISASGISRNAMSLYVNDVQNIVAIYDTGSSSVVPTTGQSLSLYTNITNSFFLNSGQKDNFYDHSSIQLYPGVPLPGGNIIVVFNYYKHTGADGYFSVTSYPNYSTIPTYTAKDGVTYQLRDCLDFRPTRKNGQASYIWEYQTGTSQTQGVEIPNNLTNFNSAYSYYLARKDLLVLTKDNLFSFVRGTPSVNPIFPKEPNGALVLANISLDPYTSIIGTEGDILTPANLSLQKVIHKRWAKSDISDLQTQVNNLEYYTTLSILEQNANALQVPDVNGLNRFKNGILVDDFSSFGVARTDDPSYAANINIRAQQLSPVTFVDNFQLQNPLVLASYGTLQNTPTNGYAISSISGTQTNIFTLPYTTANLVSQPLASNTISVNPFSVIVQEGVARITPPMDNWVTWQESPALLTNDPNSQFSQVPATGLNVIHAGDYQSLIGVRNTTPTNKQGTSANSSIYSGQTKVLTQSPSTSSTALAVNNGYVTNVAVLPYIRPQELIIRAKNMLVNTPVQCWFDGQSVNQYMTAPNTIELTKVVGTFNEDDIVGFYQAGVGFFPIARVVSLHNYPNTSNTRLYIADLITLPSTVPTNYLINATYNENGQYVVGSNTASANVVFNANSIVSIHNSGSVTGIGSYGVTGGTIQTFKAPRNSAYCDFLNFYGIWGDNNASASFNPQTNGLSFTFYASAAGTYLLTGSADNSATVYIDGTSQLTIPGFGTTYTKSITLTAGTHTVSWNATNTGGPAAFGLTIQNSAKNVVWDTLTPSQISTSNNSSQLLPGGGAYYTSATTFSLDTNASTVTGFYNGSTINIKSTYIYGYNYGALYIPPYPPLSGDSDAANLSRYNADKAAYLATATQSFYGGNSNPILLAATQTFSGTVLAYDGSTRTVTLASSSLNPGTTSTVNVSLGVNSQYKSINSQYSISGINYSVAGAIKAGTGNFQLSTDESGQFLGIFQVPGSVFFIGERVFRVDNRLQYGVATDPGSATTWAEATFYANALTSTTQRVDFSPSVDSSVKHIAPIDNDNSVKQNSTNNDKNKRDPLAQSFIIDKSKYPNGVFLSSIKLFFASKPTSQNIPIQLSICGTINGYPNGQILDHSTVTLQPQQVNVSASPSASNSATWTTFTFDAPVYVQPDTLYAIILKSNAVDYYVYLGEQNAKAISSTGVTKIGAAPYVGSLFESQNSITWTADQTRDLMFIIDKCVFDTTKTPSIPFITPINLPHRKYGRYDIASQVTANTVPNMNSYFSPSVPMDAFNVSTTDFIPSLTSVNYSYQSTLYNTFAQTSPAPVTPGRYGAPAPDNTYLNDGQGERALLNTSANSFSLYATLSSSDPNVSPIISDDGISLYNITYHINNMSINNSYISIANTGTGYNGNTANLGVINISAPTTANGVQASLGFTTNTTTGAITSVYVINPGSGYLTTPTITISDPTTRGGNSNAVISFSGETTASGGHGYAKYITKKVVLNPGNDAGDLRVFYTAYKPVGSDVYVYYKILNSADTSSFDAQNWQLMTQVTQLNSYSTSRTNLIEYEYAPGVYGSGAANNNISYTSTNGTTYSKFIQFAIKVVMASSDATNVPYLTDIRAIALPSGTGI